MEDERKLSAADERLQGLTNWIDYTHVEATAYKGLRRREEKIKSTQDRKLQRSA